MSARAASLLSAWRGALASLPQDRCRSAVCDVVTIAKNNVVYDDQIVDVEPNHDIRVCEVTSVGTRFALHFSIAGVKTDTYYVKSPQINKKKGRANIA